MAHSVGDAGAAGREGSVSFRNVDFITFQNSIKILIISLIAQSFLAALKIGLAVSFSLKNLHSIMILPFAIVAYKGVVITLIVSHLMIVILNEISLEVLQQSFSMFLKNKELSKCWDKHFISHYSNQQKITTYFSVINGVFYSIIPTLSVALLPSILLSVVNALRAINYNPIEHRNAYYKTLSEKREAFLEELNLNKNKIQKNSRAQLINGSEEKIWKKIEANAKITNKPFSEEDRVDGTSWILEKYRLCNFLLRRDVIEQLDAIPSSFYQDKKDQLERFWLKLWELERTRSTSNENELENSQQRWLDTFNQLSSLVRELSIRYRQNKI